MSDGQQPPKTTPQKPHTGIPSSADPGQVPPAQLPPTTGDQVPPIRMPVTSLAPPPGGGKKPWVIMAVLAVLIGLGMWVMMGMGDKEDDSNEDPNEEKVAQKAPKKRAKPRKAEETTSRPLKKEMAELSVKNREKFAENVGKWVRLQGEVRTGDEEGLIVFKDPAKMRGQLVKGSAEHLTGKIVNVIGWMISEELIQIDGIFEITVIDPVDLLPKKDVYTTEDAAQLISLRNTKATFKGKVKKVRLSVDKKNLVMEFEGDSYEFIGTGNIKQLEKVEVTEETLKELIGKTIKLKGKLSYLERVGKEDGKKDQIIVLFEKKEDYEIVE
jgi:hypothetical protein